MDKTMRYNVIVAQKTPTSFEARGWLNYNLLFFIHFPIISSSRLIA